MLSLQPPAHASLGDAGKPSEQEQKSKVPALNLSSLPQAAPALQPVRASLSARGPQKPSSSTPRSKAALTSRDPPTPDVHHQISSLRPHALLSARSEQHALEQSYRPSASRIDERIDMRPFSEAGTSMIGSEELGRVQASLLKHVPVGGHRHYSHVAEAMTQRFSDFAHMMAVSTPKPNLNPKP
jgi:hypothetical protein